MGLHFLGVDVGGTYVKLGLCNAEGRVVARARVPTPPASGGGLRAETLSGFIRSFVLDHGLQVQDLRHVGVGIPGVVVQGGEAWAPNLGWEGVQVGQALERTLGVAVTLDNDANAAAWGEYVAGAGRGEPDLVLITLGTGVGCGIISRGRLLRGAFGQAGELGHITVVLDGDSCNCGKRGCLETKAGTLGLWRRAGFVGAPDVERVFQEASRGNEQAIEALQEYFAYLGVALSTVVALVDPRIILIGGGIGRAGEPLFQGLAAEMDRQLGHQFRTRPSLRPALLGNDAGIIGCALMGIGDRPKCGGASKTEAWA